jgi:hypothetical protein
MKNIRHIGVARLAAIKRAFFLKTAVYKVEYKEPPTSGTKEIFWHGRHLNTDVPVLPKGDKIENIGVLFEGEVYVGDIGHGERIHPVITMRMSEDLGKDRYSIEDNSEDGFLTSSGYFLTRKQALALFGVSDSLDIDLDQDYFNDNFSNKKLRSEFYGYNNNHHYKTAGTAIAFPYKEPPAKMPHNEELEKPAILHGDTVYTVGPYESLHLEILDSMKEMLRAANYDYIEDDLTEGFLTSSGYFLTRTEAYDAFGIDDSLQLKINSDDYDDGLW